ncbi:hypothetical protein [Pseudomonas sp. B21-028]|jgi:hypothetical protein|nr:hypothetical protein [Pseudomonas sp. B21-028]
MSKRFAGLVEQAEATVVTDSEAIEILQGDTLKGARLARVSVM